MTIEKSILEVVLPKGSLDYFDIKSFNQDEENLSITLEEKNIPPVNEVSKEKKIVSKGFHDITVTDFPIRGRRTLITFRRRYWQIEGESELLKRDIKLSFPGTKLEKEFAVFLKEGSGRGAAFTKYYPKISQDPS